MVVVFLTLVSLFLTILVGAALVVATQQVVGLVVRRIDDAPERSDDRPTYWDDARRTLRALALRRPARR